MASVPRFVCLETEDQVRSAFPVIRELRTHLGERTYAALVREAMEKEGYRLVALYDQDRIVAVVGFMPMITLDYGHFVWVSDLVTAAGERSKGYGQVLLSYVHDWAKAHGYNVVALSSGVQRVDAHCFYEQKMGYQRVSHVFLKRLF